MFNSFYSLSSYLAMNIVTRCYRHYFFGLSSDMIEKKACLIYENQ